jgi:hypothetical protein
MGLFSFGPSQYLWPGLDGDSGRRVATEMKLSEPARLTSGSRVCFGLVVRSADEKALHKVVEIGGILLLWGSRPSWISPIIQSRWSGGLAVNETPTSWLAFLPFKGWTTKNTQLIPDEQIVSICVAGDIDQR